MTLNTTKVEGPSRKVAPLEAGNYAARIVQIIDLGLQPQSPYKGQEKKPAPMVQLTYELGSEFMEDEDGEPDLEKPRWISESFPLFSLGAEKAKSTRRYKALDPEGVYDGDFAALVDSPCTLTVVQNPKEGTDIIYNNVGEVTPPMKGFDTPALVNDAVVFDLDEPDAEVFERLPDWIKERIVKNLNFEGSALQARLQGDASTVEASDEDINEEDIPY